MSLRTYRFLVGDYWFIVASSWCSFSAVASTTPAGLPGWGPRSAPGSVLRDEQPSVRVPAI